MKIQTLVTIIGVILLSSTLNAANLREAKIFAKRAEVQMRKGGYKLVTTRGAKLKNSEDKTFRLLLYKGVKYALLGYGERSVKDLDVQIYNSEWKLVKEDYSSNGAMYAIFFKPKTTGVYYINTIMYEGSGYFFLSVGWN
jgi:hypothetical protein